MIVQFCGLSGSGKTTLANRLKKVFNSQNIPVEIIDGDEYRLNLCSDLGFSKEDRNTNIRRLAFVASRFSKHNILTIICAINPYQSVREEVKELYKDVLTVYVECDTETLNKRDTKGLYYRAKLPEGHPDKLYNLSGVNDPFDIPLSPDITINTANVDIQHSTDKLASYIMQRITTAAQV